MLLDVGKYHKHPPTLPTCDVYISFTMFVPCCCCLPGTLQHELLLSARFRKTRRYTNVVWCEVLSARISKTGCYTNGLLLPENPAFGAKPRPECSTNFFLGPTHSFKLSFSFPRFVAWPLELGLGTHNPRFVPWPLELGLGTHNPRFVAWPLELGLGTHNPRFVVWPLELGLGTHNPRFGVAARVGVRDSQSTLCCVAPRVGVRDSQSMLCCVAPRVGVRDSQSTLRCGPSSWG